MFIYSVRASGLLVFAVILIAAVLVLIIATGGRSVLASSSTEISFTGIKTDEDRRAFINSLGVKLKGGAVEEMTFVMPESFDRIMLGYNEIQKAQGLDLSGYAKKRITRYTYEMDGYDGYEGTVYVNLLVYRSRVIGCDISSADPEGFVEPLIKQI